jgi:hypothetical protein
VLYWLYNSTIVQQYKSTTEQQCNSTTVQQYNSTTVQEQYNSTTFFLGLSKSNRPLLHAMVHFQRTSEAYKLQNSMQNFAVKSGANVIKLLR